MIENKFPRIMWWAIFIGCLIIIPLFLPGYWRDVLVLFTINVILVLSYRLIVTMGGWSFAHIAIMGLGAYATALVTTKFFHLSFWLGIPIGGLSAAVFALLISYPVLRTKQFYFFLSTFAAGEALRQSFIQFPGIFGGIEGIPFIQRPRPILGYSFNSVIHFYHFVLVLAIASGWLLYRIDKSRTGRTIKAVSMNEGLSESIGINTWGHKALAFVIGSFFAGIAGAIFSNYNGFAAPTDYTSDFMYKIITSAIVGGTRTAAGPILGLALVTLLQEVFRNLHQWVPLVFGGCIIGTLLFLPHGFESKLQWVQIIGVKVQLRLLRMWEKSEKDVGKAKALRDRIR